MIYKLKKYKKKPNYYNDFYNSINYKWLNNNNIPKENMTFNIFTQTQYKINNKLKKLIEKGKYPLITKLYKSYLDYDYRNKYGIIELKKILVPIDKIKTYKELIILATKLIFINVSTIFDLLIDINMYNSNEYILFITQSNLFLPDKSYYLDDKYKKILYKYKNIIDKIYKYIYPKLNNRTKIINKIIEIETNLAKNMLNHTDMRDINSIYHLLSKQEINDSYNKLNINDVVNTLEMILSNKVKNKFNNIIMEYSNNNNYFKELEKLLYKYSLEDWKIYFKFKIIINNIYLTNYKLKSLHLKLYSSVLKKKDNLKHKALLYTCNMLNKYISNIYYDNFFDKNINHYVKEMIDYIKFGVKDRITNSKLFSNNTKIKALEKIDNMGILIGYNDNNNFNYNIKLSNSIFKNNILLTIQNTKHLFNKIINKVDRFQWNTSSFEVNAYYNSTKNLIVFPAAILDSAFIDINKTDIYNYARLGAIIGHEIIHGFDDNGSKFDKNGDLKSWWDIKDKTNFINKVNKIIDIYNNEGINGILTAGENIADFGAVVMSLVGLKKKLNRDLTKRELRNFYRYYASLWRTLINPKIINEKILTDPHAFPELRVNIPIKHQIEFQYAFDIKPHHKMFVPKNELFQIW